MQHTLLECPGFAKLREEMWSKGRETDLSKLILGAPALAAKVSKFLIATGELYQYRYLTGSQAKANDEVSHSRRRGARPQVTR